MRLIDDLCAEHRILEQHAERLLRVVEGEMPDAAAVAALRWNMAQTLEQHCGREDSAVYERLLESEDATARAVAWHYRREHGALTGDFGLFIAQWPVERITAEWKLFGEECRAVIASLALRIEREEAVLYVHAERVMDQRAAA